MPVDRYDFVDPDTKCHHGCGKSLTSGAGYIAVDDEGREHAYGKHCLQQVYGEGSHRGVPDFTSRVGQEARAGGGGGGRLTDGETDKDRLHAEAIRYLKLRMELLASLKGINRGVTHPPMKAIYDVYLRDHAISEEQVAHVLAMEAKAPPVFKWENLLDVHTARHQIDHAIRRSSDNEWLDGYLRRVVRPALLAELWLSEEQVKNAKLDLRKDAFGFTPTKWST